MTKHGNEPNIPDWAGSMNRFERRLERLEQSFNLFAACLSKILTQEPPGALEEKLDEILTMAKLDELTAEEVQKLKLEY